MKRAILILTFVVIIFAGCSGELKYTRPSFQRNVTNTIVVQKSKEEVWRNIVPAIGKQFFVINNLDKESGIINISYSGDPQKYVDCGYIYSYVKKRKRRKDISFPCSKGLSAIRGNEQKWTIFSREEDELGWADEYNN